MGHRKDVSFEMLSKVKNKQLFFDFLTLITVAKEGTTNSETVIPSF